MRRLLILLPVIFFSLVACRKDNTMVQTKLLNYMVLCPNGINSCYDTCGTDNHIGSSPTGSQMASYESCKSQCDTYCNLAYLLLFSN